MSEDHARSRPAGIWRIDPRDELLISTLKREEAYRLKALFWRTMFFVMMPAAVILLVTGGLFLIRAEARAKIAAERTSDK